MKELGVVGDKSKDSRCDREMPNLKEEVVSEHGGKKKDVMGMDHGGTDIKEPDSDGKATARPLEDKSNKRGIDESSKKANKAKHKKKKKGKK